MATNFGLEVVRNYVSWEGPVSAEALEDFLDKFGQMAIAAGESVSIQVVKAPPMMVCSSHRLTVAPESKTVRALFPLWP